METEAERLLRALVDKLELVHESPQYKSVWTLFTIHGGTYHGPSYAKELVAAQMYLTMPETRDQHIDQGTLF